MLLIKSALHAAERKCVVDDEVETFRTEMWTHPDLSFAVKLKEFNVNLTSINTYRTWFKFVE